MEICESVMVVGQRRSAQLSMQASSSTASTRANAPRGIDDILSAQRQAKESASKPTFLTKAQRAQQALEKRQAEVETARLAALDAARNREELQAQALQQTAQARAEERQSYNGQQGGQRGGRGGYRGRGNQQQQQRGTGYRNGSGRFDDRSQNGLNYDDTPSMPPPPPPPSGPSADRTKRPLEPELSLKPANELAAPSALLSSTYIPPTINESLIKSRYLGQHQDKKRKVRKQSDKKFTFDWDKTDDTGSGEVDSIYRSHVDGKPGELPGSQLLYGRGRYDPPPNATNGAAVDPFVSSLIPMSCSLIVLSGIQRRRTISWPKDCA